MNATDTRDDEIAHYIAAVEDALSDLPPHVREELIGDLVDHLTEIAGEITMAVPLAARLGPPEGYAAELRSTLPSTADPGAPMPPPAALAPSPVEWQALADRLDRGIGEVFGFRRATELLHAMRPGWWVARALLLGVGAMLLLGDGYSNYDTTLPAVIVTAGFTMAALVASVRLGRKTSVSARLTAVVANVGAAVVFAIGCVAATTYLLPIY